MKLRESVRALVLDENDATLLVRFDWDGLDVPGGFWANPGGGIEPGEGREDALARELLEELGFQLTGLGPEIWTKTALFPMTQWDGQIDHIHLVRVKHFVPHPHLTTDQLLAENIHDIRWWTPDELAASDTTFAPRALPKLMGDLLARGFADNPIVVTGF